MTRLSVTIVVALGTALVLPARLMSADARRNAEIPVAAVTHAGPVDFEKEILPVFSTSCLACHNKAKPKAGLILETPGDIRKGGDDGPVVKPGKSAESLLLKAAAHAPEVDAPMPPPNNKVAAPDLLPEQLGLIKLWIDQGATGEVHGTLAPVKWQAMPAALDPIFAVAVSPDGKFAACGRANRIDVYDLSAGKLSTRLVDPQLSSAGPDAAHRDMVESLAFSPDGTTLASGSYREVKLWQRKSGGEQVVLGDKVAACVATSRDARRIAVAGADGAIRVWDAKAGDSKTAKPVAESAGNSAAIVAMEFSPDGEKLLEISNDKKLQIWAVNAPGSLKLFCKTDASAELRCAAWISSKIVAAGGSDGSLTAYALPNTADSEMPVSKTFKDSQSPVTGIVALADQTHLLASRQDGGVYRVSLGSGSIRALFKQDSAITALAIRSDSKRVATAGADNIARIWTIEDGKMIAELKGDPVLAAREKTADRALALAKGEVAYRKARVESIDNEARASAERSKKAADALPAATSALADAQKAFDSAKAAMDASDKAVADKKQSAARDLASAETELKSAKDLQVMAASESAKAKDTLSAAERDLAAAQAADNQAKSARDNLQTKDEGAKEAAAKTVATADERLQKAKDAFAAATDQRQKGRDGVASAEKSLVKAQRNLDAAKTARDAAENPHDAKGDPAAKDLAKADDDLRKAKNARAAADDEVKLSARAMDDYAAAAKDARTFIAVAEQRLALRQKDADAAKSAIGGSAKPIRAIAFSPSGHLIATTGDDGTVHTWNSENGSAGDVLGHEAGPLTAVAFVGADRLLIAPSGAPPAILSPSSSWSLARTIGGANPPPVFSDRVTSLDFSPDGHWLATGGGVPSRSGEIRILDAETGSVKQAFDDVHSDTVFCVRFSPDGSRLATAGADRFVRVLDLNTGKVLRALEGHAGQVLAVAWSHDGHTLASGGADNTLRFWDSETGERGKIVAGFDKEVTSVSFLGDEAQAVADSGDGKVRLVRVDGNDVRSYPGATDFMYGIATSPDGAVLIAGGQDGILRAWNGTSAAPIATFNPVESTEKR